MERRCLVPAGPLIPSGLPMACADRSVRVGPQRGPRDLDSLSAALVSAGYRVVRPEPRGFGESVGPVDGVDLRDIAADVAAAIEATHSAPAIVGGWAYGNRVARMLATERPQLVRGLVLIAAGGKFPPAPGVFESLRDAQDNSLPIEKRAEISRRIAYGPKTNISVADMHLDDSSAATIKAQSLAPSPSTPVESWWAGGKVSVGEERGGFTGIFEIVAATRPVRV